MQVIFSPIHFNAGECSFERVPRIFGYNDTIPTGRRRIYEEKTKESEGKNRTACAVRFRVGNRWKGVPGAPSRGTPGYCY
jgi:hypothetical protein